MSRKEKKAKILFYAEKLGIGDILLPGHWQVKPTLSLRMNLPEHWIRKKETSL